MPVDHSIATTAAELFAQLTADSNFDIVQPDLSGEIFNQPDEIGNELYADVDRVTNADLTTKDVDGTGLFDELMAALSAHLKTQFDKGRITGQDFAEAYVALTQTAMSTASGFLLGKDQAYWQAQLAQKQARAAEIAVVSERINMEINKTRLGIAQVEAQVMETNYATAKLKLTEQKAAVEAAEYQTNFILPKQLEKADADIVNVGASTSRLTAEKDQALYQTASILPAQKQGIDAETAIKVYQLSDQLPAQVASVVEETAGKAYTNANILPANLLNIREQAEGQRAKTLDTRTDGLTLVKGAIGKQKDLQQQQIESYQHDSQQKVVKNLLDSWITQKSVDEGLVPPLSLRDDKINSAMATLRLSVGLD